MTCTLCNGAGTHGSSVLERDVYCCCAAGIELRDAPEKEKLYGCGQCSDCLEKVPWNLDNVFDHPTMRMILCPTCGNKRCPKATSHGLVCTHSNDPGQEGSSYR